jgi:hypothetical protein
LHGTWTALLGLALHDPGADPLYDLLRDEPEATFPEDEHLPLFTRELLLMLHAGERPNADAAARALPGSADALARRRRACSRSTSPPCSTCTSSARNPPGPPFDDPGCKLYPVEVLAVRSVREWLSLPMPKVDHPLMFTATSCTMAPNGPWPKHDLLQRLERELRRAEPGRIASLCWLPSWSSPARQPSPHRAQGRAGHARRTARRGDAGRRLRRRGGEDLPRARPALAAVVVAQEPRRSANTTISPPSCAPACHACSRSAGRRNDASRSGSAPRPCAPASCRTACR